MELRAGRSRAGSVAAGGYDELLTPLICEAQSEPADGGAGFDSSRDGGAPVTKRSSRSSQNVRQMSVRSRSSVHGAEIRRQDSGGAPDGGGGLRVKSTVSGFLNRDYYTPNDSVPLIRVSESYTRLFVHTSDEETDSEVEEVIEKKFGTEAKNLKDALKTNFAVRKSALGIPRMEGHMRLPDRKSSHTDAKERLYRGQNYLVELPYRLERSTRALTRTAIGRAVDDERSRRVLELRQRGAAVSEAWLAVQAELRRLARDAEQGDVEATITATQGCEDHMELVREQLVHSVHRRAVRVEVAEAQQWKQMFFKGISKNKLPPDAMEAVASTSEHMGSVLEQLQEAFSCSQLDESSRQEVVQERAQDLKDGCLTELLRCVATQKIKIEITIETERQVQEFRRGRPVAARKSGSQDGVDLGAAKQALGGSLAKIFKRVDDRETKREDRGRERVLEFKTVCQEDLIRKVWRRKVTALCSHEKARRIVESEDPAVMADPDRERISDHWVRVQAQMIVDKFMGKKPMKKTSVTEVLHDRSGSPSPIRSALDRRLKAVRERFRRPAVYFCDEDDTFARQRARRRTSLTSPSQARLGSRSSLAHSSASELPRRRRSSSPSPRRSGQLATAASQSSRAPAGRGSQSRQQSPSRQPSASRSSSRQRQSVAGSPTRQSSATRSPSRQPSTTRSPSRQPSVTRSPSRQPSATRSPSRQPSATRSPSRQQSATRSQSKQSSVERSSSRQSSGAAAAAGGSPRRHSANSSSRQTTVTAKRSSRRPSAASGAGVSSRRQSAAASGAARSASYASARSSVSPEPRRSGTRRRSGSGSGDPAAAAGAGGGQSSSPAGILKNAESGQRASSAAVSPRRESRTKQSRSLTSSAAGAAARAGAGADPRRSPSSGGSARRGRSGGDVKEVLAPRRLGSETAPRETASRSYRRRGEKTDEFRQERQEIADTREHEHSQKLERKRSRSAGKTSDQYRSHWTARVQE